MDAFVQPAKSASWPPMQKPPAPSLAVEEWPARYAAAPRRSFSGPSMLSAMKSLPAPSGSLAVLPWDMSGASPEKPPAAPRAHTPLIPCPGNGALSPAIVFVLLSRLDVEDVGRAVLLLRASAHPSCFARGPG